MPIAHSCCAFHYIMLFIGGCLQGEVDIVSPMALGGFGSEQFLAANPQNKVC